ncbi:DNA ligase [Paenibacillus thiaminolyticus]|uniref:DNA ligase n=1 Tax=Paenibacillus thiaminolyticus TaxID=49283 RepID=A0A3A3GGX6_PANTH|nr:DNA ligase [Paenibacillus thiaminolyticus]RJG22273.1 DNA ligase [Paenibacillus thiaminolyticus]
MNISQMVRGLVGEARPGEQRTLELKSGQVVRGTVASVAENGREAVIQINGVPVRAVLDTPMRPGQTAWLQVQGQQADGMIMLKAADGPAFAQLPSIEEALKQSGLPDEGWARRLLHELQKGGVPLTKELASRLAQALAAKPQGVPAEQWMQAAGLALRRQLPLSGETLRGLQQAMFGKPLNDLLAGFQRAGEAALARSAGGPAGVATPWAAPLREAQALVRDIMASLPRMDSAPGAGPNGQTPAPAATGGNPAAQAASAAGQSPEGSSPAVNAAPNAGSGPAAGTAATGTPLTASAAAGPVAATAVTGGEGGAAAAGAAGQTSAAGGGAWIGRLLQLLGVPHEQQVHRAAVLEMTAAGSGAPQGDGVPGRGASAESTAVRPQPGSAAPPAAGAASSAAAQAPAMPGTPASPEAAARPQATQVPASGGTPEKAPAAEPGAAARAAAATAPEAAQAPPQQSAAQTTAAPAESLKSALLQLLQSEALPPAVREAAQQLVHQITGQQLLLTSDRQAPFTHVTLFVPLVTPDGQQTAAVHIQSRQSRRGELESDNCRLWFDLNMKALGRTLVDVQVVEQAVALHIHQTDEAIGEWLGGFRGEVEEAMNRIGYQLSAFRILPMPDTKVDEPKNRPEIDMDDYALQPYKGVDIKI